MRGRNITLLIILFVTVFIGAILYSFATTFEVTNIVYALLFGLFFLQTILLLPREPYEKNITKNMILIFVILFVFTPNFYLSLAFILVFLYSSDICSNLRFKINKHFLGFTVISIFLQILAVLQIFYFRAPFFYAPYLVANNASYSFIQTIIGYFLQIGLFVSNLPTIYLDIILGTIAIIEIFPLVSKFRKLSKNGEPELPSDFPLVQVITEKMAGFLFAVFIVYSFGFFGLGSFPFITMPIILPLIHALICSFRRFPSKTRDSAIRLKKKPDHIVPCIFSLFSVENWLVSKKRVHLVIQRFLEKNFTAVFQLDDSFGIPPEDMLFGKHHYIARYSTPSGSKAKALQRIGDPGSYSLYFLDDNDEIKVESHFEPLLDIIQKKVPDFMWFMVVDDDSYFQPFADESEEVFPDDNDPNSKNVYVYGQSYDLSRDLESQGEIKGHLSNDLISPMQNYAYMLCSKYSMSPDHSHGTGTIFPKKFLKEELLPELSPNSIVEDLNLSFLAIEHGGRVKFMPQATMRGEACKDMDSLENQILRWRNGTYIELDKNEDRIRDRLKTNQIPEKSSRKSFIKDINNYRISLQRNTDWFVNLTAPILLIGLSPIMATWPLQNETIITLPILTLFIINLLFFVTAFSGDLKSWHQALISIGGTIQISEIMFGNSVDKNSKFTKTEKYKRNEKNPIIFGKFPWFTKIFLITCLGFAELNFSYFFYLNWNFLWIFFVFCALYLLSLISKMLDLYRNQIMVKTSAA